MKAAQAINARIEQLAAPNPLSPAVILQAGPEGLRSCGVSPQKVRYLLDLATKTADGHVRLERIGRYGDEQVIDQLIVVTGIGRWTAQMFLIFALGRLDVLPVDDLGLRSAMRNLYGLGELPEREECETLAFPWRPYASIASWYCWRSLELK